MELGMGAVNLQTIFPRGDSLPARIDHPPALGHRAAAGDAAPWLCLRNRRASATNEMPNTIE
jgi:hypothetical protein